MSYNPSNSLRKIVKRKNVCDLKSVHFNQPTFINQKISAVQISLAVCSQSMTKVKRIISIFNFVQPIFSSSKSSDFHPRVLLANGGGMNRFRFHISPIKVRILLSKRKTIEKLMRKWFIPHVSVSLVLFFKILFKNSLSYFVNLKTSNSKAFENLDKRNF